MSNFLMLVRIYEAVAKTSEYLSPEVVEIAEQIVNHLLFHFVML